MRCLLHVVTGIVCCGCVNVSVAFFGVVLCVNALHPCLYCAHGINLIVLLFYKCMLT